MSLESSQGTTLTPRKSRATNRMRRLITVMASVSMLVMALVIFPESSVKPDVASAACYGSTYVSGYVKSNGTYVSGHYRTCPDSSPYNNYSFPGNYNPNSGRITGGSRSSYIDNYYGYSSYSPRVYTSSSYSGYGSNLYGSSGYGYGSSLYGSSGYDYGSIFGGR